MAEPTATMALERLLSMAGEPALLAHEGLLARAYYPSWQRRTLGEEREIRGLLIEGARRIGIHLLTALTAGDMGDVPLYAARIQELATAANDVGARIVKMQRRIDRLEGGSNG